MSDPLPRHLQMGLIARDLASLRLRTDAAARQQVRERLVERLGLVHGLPQKIGQILAFTDPGEDHDLFQRLTEDSSSPAPEQALAILKEALRHVGVHRLQDAFQDVSLRSIDASIGQVHCAVLNDNRKVAVKVQHPGIQEHVQSDLKALGWLTRPISALKSGFDTASYRHEIGEMLAHELDFKREAQHIKQFAARTQSWSGLRVPQVVDAFSSTHILTMTWIEGQRLDRAATWSQEDRDALGATILRLFLHGAISWGFLHADPNPGNYRFLRVDGVPTVGLLDFGCVKTVPSRLRTGFAVLARLAGDGSLPEDDLFQCHLSMGFCEKQLAPLKSKLPEVNRILFQPFAEAGAFDLEEWRVGARLSSALGEHRMAYRTAGPADLIFFLRAFHGVIHQLRVLGARISWKDLLEQTGEELPPPPAHRTAAPDRGDQPPMKSETLHICVTEQGRTKVSLVFSAAATDNLADLVPLDLKPRLEARGICLRTIIERARAADYAPAELFSLDDEDRNVRVWLEA